MCVHRYLCLHLDTKTVIQWRKRLIWNLLLYQSERPGEASHHPVCLVATDLQTETCLQKGLGAEHIFKQQNRSKEKSSKAAGKRITVVKLSRNFKRIFNMTLFSIFGKRIL